MRQVNCLLVLQDVQNEAWLLPVSSWISSSVSQPALQQLSPPVFHLLLQLVFHLLLQTVLSRAILVDVFALNVCLSDLFSSEVLLPSLVLHQLSFAPRAVAWDL